MTQEEEIIYLRGLLDQERQEKQTIINNIKKVFKVLGIKFEEGENNKKNMIKSLTSVFTQMLTNPKALEQKFAFLGELMPIVAKYQEQEQIQ